MKVAGTTHLLCKLVQHARTDGRSVCTEDVLLGLFDLPVIFVPGSNENFKAFGRLRNVWTETNVHTPVSRILPLNEPSSLFLGNPLGTCEKVLGLKSKFWHTLEHIQGTSSKVRCVMFTDFEKDTVTSSGYVLDCRIFPSPTL